MDTHELDAALTEVGNETRAGILNAASLVKDVVERYVEDAKSAAKRREAPYVALLLDGYFAMRHVKDEHLHSTDSPGREVAQLLGAEMTEHIRGLPEVPKDLRVLIRIYVDAKCWPDAVRKSGYTALFAPAFNSVSPFCEMVEVCDRQAIKTKISENFVVFARDPECKNILFGAGFKPVYIDVLSQFQRERDKIKLVPLGQVNSLYEKLDFEIVQFNRVFRSRTLLEATFDSNPAPPAVVRDGAGTSQGGTRGSRVSLAVPDSVVASKY